MNSGFSLSVRSRQLDIVSILILLGVQGIFSRLIFHPDVVWPGSGSRFLPVQASIPPVDEQEVDNAQRITDHDGYLRGNVPRCRLRRKRIWADDIPNAITHQIERCDRRFLRVAGDIT